MLCGDRQKALTLIVLSSAIYGGRPSECLLMISAGLALSKHESRLGTGTRVMFMVAKLETVDYESEF
jgi:hypothetical protein